MEMVNIRSDYRRSEKLMAVWNSQAPLTLLFFTKEMGLQDVYMCSLGYQLLRRMRKPAFVIWYSVSLSIVFFSLLVFLQCFRNIVLRSFDEVQCLSSYIRRSVMISYVLRDPPQISLAT